MSASSEFFKPSESDYYVDNKRFLKIWFNGSGDPDNWLPELNQLRLIDMRTENPDITINLLIDRTKLSEKAIKSMEAFAENYNINLIDLNDFGASLSDDKDKKIFKFLRKELDAKGGNVAAARDLATALPTLLIQYGIYSDFDVHLSPPKVPYTDLVRVPEASGKHPVVRLLFPYVRETSGEHRYNNDLLVITQKKGESKEAFEQALREEMDSIQSKMIKHYELPKSRYEYSPLLAAAVGTRIVSYREGKYHGFEGDAVDLRGGIIEEYLTRRLDGANTIYKEKKDFERYKNSLQSNISRFIQASVQNLSQDPYFTGIARKDWFQKAIASFEGLGKAYHSNQLPFDSLIIPAGTIERTEVNADLSWLPSGLEDKYIKTELEALREKYPDAVTSVDTVKRHKVD